MFVAQLRKRRPQAQIFPRADSGFCREGLMRGCKKNGWEYVSGLARAIGAEPQAAAAEAPLTALPTRRSRERNCRTHQSWSRSRHVVAKAEHTGDKSNPRFIVTSLSKRQMTTRALDEDFYCACGERENRTRERQLDMFSRYVAGWILAPRESAALAHALTGGDL